MTTAEIKAMQRNATSVLQKGVNFSKQDIANQMKNIKRKDKALNTSYNKKNLTDDQIDKLITDNYNLDFLELDTANQGQSQGASQHHGQQLDKMADKFKNARHRLKQVNIISKQVMKEKQARNSRMSGFKHSD